MHRASPALLLALAACPADETDATPSATPSAAAASASLATTAEPVSPPPGDTWSSPTLKLRSRYQFFPSLGAATGTLDAGIVDQLVLEEPMGGAMILVEVEVDPPKTVPPELVTVIGARRYTWSPGALDPDATYRALLPMPAGGGVPHTEPAPPASAPSPSR